MLKDTSIGARVQVRKSSKGKINKEIPVPSFFAGPTHLVKVVENHIFFVVNYGKAQ